MSAPPVPQPRSPLRRRHDLQLVLFVWGIGLAQTLLTMVNDHLFEELMAPAIYAWSWLRFGLGGLALPWLVRRSLAEPFARRGLVTQFLRHVARSVAVTTTVAVAYLALRVLAGLAGGEPYEFSRLYQALLRGVFLTDVFFYLAIAVVASAVASARRLDEQEAEASRLESALLQAELGLLRAQVSPGFLFDALRAISSLVGREPAEADRVLARLGDFLRSSLEASGRPEVSLARELELLHSYLEIQRTRLGDRLRVEVAVPDAVLPALLPNLLLQSLVDTAIQHDCANARVPGPVRVAAERRVDRLVLEVAGGTGWPPGESDPGAVTGVLIQTRERLRRLYGAQQSVEIEPAATGGALVRIQLPWRSEELPDRREPPRGRPLRMEVAVER